MRSGLRTSALFAVVALALCAAGAADTPQARANNIITATEKCPARSSDDGKPIELPVGLEAALVRGEALEPRFELRRVQGFRTVVGGTGVGVAHVAHEEFFPAESQAARDFFVSERGGAIIRISASQTSGGGFGFGAVGGAGGAVVDASVAGAAGN